MTSQQLFSKVFLNAFGRLRSGWRFFIFLFGTQIIFGIVAFFISNFNIQFQNAFEISLILTNLILASVAILVGWLCGKFFERLPFRAMGISFSDNWLRNLVFGLLSGAFAILFAALIAFLFGHTSFELNRIAAPSAIALTLLLNLIVFIVGAVAEESFSRGYGLQTFARAKLVWFGILLTSALFASGHFLNPNFNLLAWANTFLAGIFFGVGYYKTRTLWFTIGSHLMWNFVQGAILGFPVSGLKELSPAPVFQISGDGIVWISGGDYGIEAGFACTVALIFVTLLIWFSPFLKPTEKMLKLTERENPQITNSSES